MATAVQATRLDNDYLRIEVLDTDGGRTKYRKGGKAGPGSELDLSVDDSFHPGKISLVVKADGTPHLQQKEAGLPKRIVVTFINLPQLTPEAGAPAGVEWRPEERFEYEQE
jgi:hypothetical protein